MNKYQKIKRLKKIKAIIKADRPTMLAAKKVREASKRRLAEVEHFIRSGQSHIKSMDLLALNTLPPITTISVPRSVYHGK